MTASNKVALTYVYGRTKAATVEMNDPPREAGQFSEYPACWVRSANTHRVRIPASLLDETSGAVAIYCTTTGDEGDSARCAIDWRDDADNRITGHLDNGSSQVTLERKAAGSGATLTVSTGVAWAAGDALLLVLGWSATTLYAYLFVNGALAASGSAGNTDIPALSATTADVGSIAGSSAHLNGGIDALAAYSTLPDEGARTVLAALSGARPPAFGEAGLGTTQVLLWYGADVEVISLASSGTCIDLNDAAGGQVMAQRVRGTGISQMNHRVSDTPLADGQVLLSSKTQPRTVVAELLIKGVSTIAEVTTLRRTVQRALNPRRGEGVLTYAPVGERLYEIDAIVGQSGAPFDEEIGRVAVQPRIPFLCNDPAWRDIVEQLDTEDSAGDGSAFPSDFPTDFLAGEWFTVENEGDLDVWPVVTIDGPVTDPFIKNVTTGRTFALSVSIAAGYSVVVDMDARTVLRSDGENLMPYRTAESQMWALQPGDNTIEAGFGSASSLPVHFEVAHAPQFVGV